MTKNEIVKIIEEEKIVFITRLADPKWVPSVLECLVDAGVKVMEITSNTPNYQQAIVNARKEYPNILIGAGTVVNKEIAEEAIKAGAQFLVTPNMNPELVAIAHQNNIPILMGALTPTEVYDAHAAGADFVKLFPGDIMGIPYFKSISAPLDNIKLMSVGGIESHMVSEWLEAGSCGIGIGSILKQPIEGINDLEEIKENAIAFLKEIKNFKS